MSEIQTPKAPEAAPAAPTVKKGPGRPKKNPDILKKKVGRPKLRSIPTGNVSSHSVSIPLPSLDGRNREILILAGLCLAAGAAVYYFSAESAQAEPLPAPTLAAVPGPTQSNSNRALPQGPYAPWKE